MKFRVVLVAVFCAVGLAACTNDRRRVDGGTGDSDGAAIGGPTVDGGGAYDDLGGTDGGACMPGDTAAMCANPVASNAGCGAAELCGTDGHGNGLDDNCDGKVDETCSCTVGNVQKCFVGPPGKHNVGGCTDGQQTCQGAEFGTWGPCVGSISPSAESCDGVDNDCNGCADDGLCCDSLLTCPTTVPDLKPYTDLALKGATYFHGAAATWSWTVTGGPCDQLFATTTGAPPAQSFTITGGNTATPTIHFTLSGDYKITMTVTDAGGHVSTCTWVQHVAGPGIRFELCWDTTGFPGSDLDLHVHKPNSTTDFFGSQSSPSADDCNYINCAATSFTAGSVPNWGYAASAIGECSGGPDGASWVGVGSCRNPRLDMDNISTLGVPENINIDNPKSADKFRALVHYYGINSFTTTLTSHPMVNIYCGGRLKTTYGQSPNQVTGFATAGAWAKGDMWRVADVTAIVDASGVTTDCTVDALHPDATTTGFVIGHDGKTTYTGN